MRDLKYYTCIYDSDEIELFFFLEKGWFSFFFKECGNYYDYFYEVIISTADALTLAEYPTDNDDLSLTERISFLFGASNGYCRFVRMCEKKGFNLKDIKW